MLEVLATCMLRRFKVFVRPNPFTLIRDWNNDALYDPLPVTIGYAKVLARVVKRMTGLGSSPYQFRFFM